MLRVLAIDVSIQTSQILGGVSLEVAPGAIACLVGRNGAGKTTTLRTIMGYLNPAAGRIEPRGQSIAGLPTHAIFGDLTVAESVLLPTWTRPTGRAATDRVEAAYAVFPDLRRLGARGAQLSGGERKMLAIACALVLDPVTCSSSTSPSRGWPPPSSPRSRGPSPRWPPRGRAILMTESNIHHVPPETTCLYVTERGEIIYAGSPEAAGRDPALARIIGA